MVQIFPDPQTVITALAHFVLQTAEEAIRARGRFTIALSGGSSPKSLYELLASDRFRKKIDWGKLYFFFGDERYVPLDHSESNYRMAAETLFHPLRIPSEQIFAVNTGLSPADAAADYEQTIIRHFHPAANRFDLVLLGLGDNSHTASLFPHTAILHEHSALVKAVFVEELKKDRISLTAPAINAAFHTAFLVFGPTKALAVTRVLQGSEDIEEYPAQLIRPTPGDVTWFLDAEAGAGLSLQA